MTQASSSRRVPAIGNEPIRRFMSRSPACIAGHRSLKDAWTMMQHERVRHLPVLEGGAVVGMISQRDLGLLGTQAPARLDEVAVEEAMSGEPYVVGPSTSLLAVVATMSAQRLGAAIIVDGGHVVGVFTTTDALALLTGLVEGIESVG